MFDVFLFRYFLQCCREYWPNFGYLKVWRNGAVEVRTNDNVCIRSFRNLDQLCVHIDLYVKTHNFEEEA